MSDYAGRSVAARAKASLFFHCCDTAEDLSAIGIDQIPHVLTFVLILFVTMTFPVSIPFIAYMRRRSDRRAIAEWETSNVARQANPVEVAGPAEGQAESEVTIPAT